MTKLNQLSVIKIVLFFFLSTLLFVYGLIIFQKDRQIKEMLEQNNLENQVIPVGEILEEANHSQDTLTHLRIFFDYGE